MEETKEKRYIFIVRENAKKSSIIKRHMYLN